MRFLNHFCIRFRKEPTKYVALEDVTSDNMTEIQALGQLIVPDETQGENCPIPDVFVNSAVFGMQMTSRILCVWMSWWTGVFSMVLFPVFG